MISVAEARALLLGLASPMPVELVPLRSANGRILAEPVIAGHAQPPFAASAMDGYALAQSPEIGTRLPVIGEAAAGHPFPGRVSAGEAVRIFTGAPVPDGATTIVIQENVTRDQDVITIIDAGGPGTHIRAAGSDFEAGYTLSQGGLRPVDLALAAAMGCAEFPVRRRPEVAILMTGDELASPHNDLKSGQIHASNGYAICAMIEANGGRCRLLPLVADTRAALLTGLRMAQGSDLVITIGGASVGDHDLVAEVSGEAGLALGFHKIRMRPGKPLLAGRLGGAVLIGLPGNPVSSIVCTHLFILPLLRNMLGLPPDPEIRSAGLAAPVPANGPREHYMRASLGPEGLHVFEDQDSSLLSVLARATALVIRDPFAPAAAQGEIARYLPI